MRSGVSQCDPLVRESASGGFPKTWLLCALAPRAYLFIGRNGFIYAIGAPQEKLSLQLSGAACLAAVRVLLPRLILPPSYVGGKYQSVAMISNHPTIIGLGADHTF